MLKIAFKTGNNYYIQSILLINNPNFWSDPLLVTKPCYQRLKLIHGHHENQTQGREN